jgi:predicted RNA-binding Zn ribbon-like protein
MTHATPPHDLSLVIDFVNTLDIDEQTDAITDASELREWLLARELLSPSDPPPGEDELHEALRLREALRALMLTHNGAPNDDRAAAQLESVARRGDLGVSFTPHGSVFVEACGEGVAAALARVLVPVAEAAGDDSWERVKACRADDCQWAFYDTSRNRSGVWCDMAVCGNREKVRAYRSRRSAPSPGQGHSA